MARFWSDAKTDKNTIFVLFTSIVFLFLLFATASNWASSRYNFISGEKFIYFTATKNDLKLKNNKNSNALLNVAKGSKDNSKVTEIDLESASFDSNNHRSVTYKGAVSDSESPLKYTDKSLAEIMKMPPIPFLRNYSSPCFKEYDDRLVCLNAFFIVGFAKSGTTDLFNRMSVHRFIEHGDRKEHFWWNKAANTGRKLSTYTRRFINSTMRLQATSKLSPDGTIYHPSLIGDFTPGYIWQNNPRATATAIGTILPSSKIIISLRHPVSRTVSDYKHFMHFYGKSWKISQRHCHKQMSESIDWFNACKAEYNDDICIEKRFNKSIKYFSNFYNKTKSSFTPAYYRFLASFHYHYVRNWLENSSLKREMFFFMSFDDYIEGPNTYINHHILPFINAEPFTQEELKRIEDETYKDEWSKFRAANETLQLLHNFFLPYNRKLYDLLKDKRFLPWLS